MRNLGSDALDAAATFLQHCWKHCRSQSGWRCIAGFVVRLKRILNILDNLGAAAFKTCDRLLGELNCPLFLCGYSHMGRLKSSGCSCSAGNKHSVALPLYYHFPKRKWFWLWERH